MKGLQLALITLNDMAFRKSGNLVRLNMGGKSYEMRPDEALEASNLLGNAAADLLHSSAGLPRVEQIHLRPFGEKGTAILRLMTKSGPLTLEVTHNILEALKAASDGALEHAAPAGSS